MPMLTKFFSFALMYDIDIINLFTNMKYSCTNYIQIRNKILKVLVYVIYFII